MEIFHFLTKFSESGEYYLNGDKNLDLPMRNIVALPGFTNRGKENSCYKCERLRETPNTRRKVDLIYQEFCGSNAPVDFHKRKRGRILDAWGCHLLGEVLRSEKRKNQLEACFYTVALKLEINSIVFKLCTKEGINFFFFHKMKWVSIFRE